jgi:hypothetical protein
MLRMDLQIKKRGCVGEVAVKNPTAADLPAI